VALGQVLSCQHDFKSTLYSYFIPAPSILSDRGDQPDEHLRRQIRQQLCINALKQNKILLFLWLLISILPTRKFGFSC
jgi:hypothetical protein